MEREESKTALYIANALLWIYGRSCITLGIFEFNHISGMHMFTRGYAKHPCEQSFSS